MAGKSYIFLSIAKMLYTFQSNLYVLLLFLKIDFSIQKINRAHKIIYKENIWIEVFNSVTTYFILFLFWSSWSYVFLTFLYCAHIWLRHRGCLGCFNYWWRARKRWRAKKWVFGLSISLEFPLTCSTWKVHLSHADTWKSNLGIIILC